jgi:pimeloyl-ACP methyl ester carboxylesterase
MNNINIQYKYVDLPNGETIAYQEREGGKKNVLLIHGNMSSSRHWDLVLEQMPPHFKLFAVDMRGFGASSYHERINSIKDFSDDMKAFLDAIRLTNFSIIGWSTGGAVGMQLATDYPGICEKLILLSSASTRGYPFYDLEGKRLTSYDEITADQGKTIPVQHAYDTKDHEFLKQLWNALIYTKNQPSKEKYDDYIADMLTQKNLAEVYHALNTFNISNVHNGLISGNGLVKNIKLPVLVLHGDRDLVITKQMAEEIITDIGHTARFVELKDCGHSPLIDDLGGLLKQFTDFLDS